MWATCLGVSETQCELRLSFLSLTLFSRAELSSSRPRGSVTRLAQGSLFFFKGEHETHPPSLSTPEGFLGTLYPSPAPGNLALWGALTHGWSCCVCLSDWPEFTQQVSRAGSGCGTLGLLAAFSGPVQATPCRETCVYSSFSPLNLANSWDV